jgi:hypothetical protein
LAGDIVGNFEVFRAEAVLESVVTGTGGVARSRGILRIAAVGRELFFGRHGERSFAENRLGAIGSAGFRNSRAAGMNCEKSNKEFGGILAGSD